MHETAEGAYTGEVSAPMLGRARRARRRPRALRAAPVFNETDRALAPKVPRRSTPGCADPVRRRDRGRARARRHRAQAAPPGPGGARRRVRRAPRGRRHRLRADLGDRHRPPRRRAGARRRSPSSARSSPTETPRRPPSVRVLYGGSVKPDNAAELLGQPDVDGALVGGASLDPASFGEIVVAAASARPGRRDPRRAGRPRRLGGSPPRARATRCRWRRRRCSTSCGRATRTRS